MISQRQIKGICQNCNSNNNCAFLKDAEQVIIHCEEYDNYTHMPERRQISTTIQRNGELDSSKGLCMDCENRKSCVNVPSDGGIWHCHEYK